MAEAHDTVGLPRGGTVGRYIVLGHIGTGAMGIVYAAYDPELDRKVALKILRVKDHRGPGGNLAEKRARLLREAKAMARLSHPNVIVVYDVGTIDDRVFIAMELVDGITVTRWREGKMRPWKDVLGIFTPAGQALAAAHAAGLVHRDFKPDNVMVGRDGKVRVMDFGLARQVERTSDERIATLPGGTGAGPNPGGSSPGVPGGPGGPAPGAEPEARLTHEGMVVGTPAYMPPEQYQGLSDARTDQFSFCVALYECLYGEYPFEGKTAYGGANAARVREAPESTRVPLWLRRVVLRGLRPRPEDRYPSMQALLAALVKDPAVRRRRWLLTASTLLFLVGVGFAAQHASSSRRAFCAAGPTRVAAAWELAARGTPDGARRTAIRHALLATGKPYAPDTVRGVFRILDDYATRWTTLYREACEATQVRGEQSEEVLDLRMGCLNDRLSSLKALTDLFSEATDEVVERAIDAAHALTPLDGCSDIKQLKALIPPPEPAVKSRVEALRRELGRIKALYDGGRYAEALERLQPVAVEAKTLDYQPLRAEIMERVGMANADLNKNAEAEMAFDEAFTSALASHHDDLIAEIAGNLVWVLGFQERFAEADRWTRFAEAAIERTGRPNPIVHAWLLNNVAAVLHVRGRFAEALEYSQRALTLKERALGLDNPDLAITVGNIALTLSALGRGSEALTANDRALRITRLSLGNSHPRVADQLNNRGEILVALSRLPDALNAYSEAQQIFEREFAPDEPMIAYALTGAGSTLTKMGRSHDALPILERALEIRNKRDPDPSRLGETEFALAKALWETRAEPERATALARKALDSYAHAPLSRERRVDISSWLARHDHGRVSSLARTAFSD